MSRLLNVTVIMAYEEKKVIWRIETELICTMEAIFHRSCQRVVQFHSIHKRNHLRRLVGGWNSVCLPSLKFWNRVLPLRRRKTSERQQCEGGHSGTWCFLLISIKVPYRIMTADRLQNMEFIIWVLHRIRGFCCCCLFWIYTQKGWLEISMVFRLTSIY